MKSRTTAARSTRGLVTGTALIVCACGARTGLQQDAASDDPALGSSGGRAGAGGSAANPPLACVDGTFVLDRAVPAVMLVLDRSRSMDASFGTGKNRWEVLTDALATALPSVDDTMSLGALVFPSSRVNDACDVPTAADVGLGFGHAQNIVTTMRAAGPGGATPTADALIVAGNALLANRVASTARTMVLATDGGPGCNTSLDRTTCRCIGNQACNSATRCLDDVRTVDRIASFSAAGVPTYVIGIERAGDTTSSEVLDAMAKAGGRPQTGANHAYYGASSATELGAALTRIRDQVGACTYLTRSVPDATGSIAVVLEGATLPYDESGRNGWRWASRANGEVVFSNEACAALATARAAPTVTVRCAAASDDPA